MAFSFLAPLSFVAVTFYAYNHRLRGWPAFSTALQLVQSSDQAKAVLGDQIQAGTFVRGVVQDTSAAGYALLSIPVYGSRGKGVVYVVANRVRPSWNLERVALWAADSHTRIDLSPPSRPEAFHYPAKGHVYLLPLDESAASAIQDFPPYCSARLGLAVTILPVSHLDPGAVNQQRRQVRAEKGIDFIRRASGPVNEDLDAVFVGVTSQDMTIETAGWSYATNYRHTRFAVLSTHRFLDMPWLAGANPEAFSIRVRKMLLKNIAMLSYPLSLSQDPTSALSTGIFSAADADQMGENFLGENGTWSSGDESAPCVSITQGLGRQTWSLAYTSDPLGDPRFEEFQNYTDIQLFVLSRSDFVLGQDPDLSFVRAYRPQDDRSRAFGIGTNHSFDVFLIGDSHSFSYVELILQDGGRVHYRRVSPGTGLGNAKFKAASLMGSRFSLSTIVWNGKGWDLSTIDGWTYKFPACGPRSSPQQCAVVGIESPAGAVLSIERNSSGDLQRAYTRDGAFVELTLDNFHRTRVAKDNLDHSVEYEYDDAGRLVHIRDSDHGDEFYEYDPANRMTAVLDKNRRPVLVNTYGYSGEVTSQTLADGRKFIYEYGWDYRRKLASLTLTDPNGFVTRWMRGANGFSLTLPAQEK